MCSNTRGLLVFSNAFWQIEFGGRFISARFVISNYRHQDRQVPGEHLSRVSRTVQASHPSLETIRLQDYKIAKTLQVSTSTESIPILQTTRQVRY